MPRPWVGDGGRPCSGQKPSDPEGFRLRCQLACTDAREIPEGADVVLGFDGSYSGDATAIVAVQIGDVPHLDVVRLWEHPGSQVPIVDVEDALREACKRWRVQTIVADPFRWARSLQLLADEGLPVGGVPAVGAAHDAGHSAVRRGRAQPGADPLR
jgi:hypothetical protein